MAANPQDKETTATKDRETTATKPNTTEADTSTKRGTAGEGHTITIPSMRSLGATAERSLGATADVVEPKHLMWFGALVVAGAAGVIEWPVVAAVGIGSVITERFARAGNRRHQT